MSSIMQPRDKWIPWYFVIFFIVVIVVNVIMATLAIRTNSGMVTEHPYETGIAYNQVVQAQQKQEALRWKSDINYIDGTLQFSLMDKQGQVIVPDKVVATITRPTQAGMDFSKELQGVKTPITFPAKGQWEVRVDAVYKDVHYQQSKRIVVQ